MNLIAHRGVQKNGTKENSLESFQKAIDDNSFVGFEFDIRTSKDGVFVIHHNIFIDGKLINSLTFQELKKQYNIPSLEDVLRFKTKKIMLLEIKEPNLNIKDFISLIQKYPEVNLYIDSFDNSIIQKLRKEKTSAKFGVLNYILNSEKDYSEYHFIGLLSPIITEELLHYFIEKHLEVFIYGNQKNTKFEEREHVYYIVDAK